MNRLLISSPDTKLMEGTKWAHPLEKLRGDLAGDGERERKVRLGTSRRWREGMKKRRKGRMGEEKDKKRNRR